jgi:uncharacterized protein (DUF2147 family)
MTGTATGALIWRIPDRSHRIRRPPAHRARRRVLLIAALVFLAVFPAASAASLSVSIPQGVWLMDGKVAVGIFDCSNKMCGRILWLLVPRDPQGRLQHDKKNPNPALRSRPLCGLTILWNLQPTGRDSWGDGWFYNPEDGNTYNVSAKLASADVMIARIYVGIPFFGKTKTLVRVLRNISAGGC